MINIQGSDIKIIIDLKIYCIVFNNFFEYTVENGWMDSSRTFRAMSIAKNSHWNISCCGFMMWLYFYSKFTACLVLQWVTAPPSSLNCHLFSTSMTTGSLYTRKQRSGSEEQNNELLTPKMISMTLGEMTKTQQWLGEVRRWGEAAKRKSKGETGRWGPLAANTI